MQGRPAAAHVEMVDQAIFHRQHEEAGSCFKDRCRVPCNPTAGKGVPKVFVCASLGAEAAALWLRRVFMAAGVAVLPAEQPP